MIRCMEKLSSPFFLQSEDKDDGVEDMDEDKGQVRFVGLGDWWSHNICGKSEQPIFSLKFFVQLEDGATADVPDQKHKDESKVEAKVCFVMFHDRVFFIMEQLTNSFYSRPRSSPLQA